MKLTRYEVLGKCVVVFEAMKRLASRGNAGLEPIRGAEDDFWLDAEILDTLRQMMREQQAEDQRREQEKERERQERLNGEKVTKIADWQREVMEHGVPEELRLT